MGKLAITGGAKLRTKGFPSWPVYGKEESEGLERVLKSLKWGTLGPEAAKFTEKFTKYLDVKHGVAVTNGTVTMEVLLKALGVGYGDEVIIPPYTFVATVSAVISAGATPVFVDIEEDTFNMDADKLEACITPATKAIIPVHVGGRSCDMDKIMAVAQKHNLFVIEDTAHAHGSEWDGKKSGSIGTAGSFSFQASKNLTSGEGGFISTNDTSLFEKCWAIHHCGRDYHGTVWYGHPFVGTNARMTEWQAVILNAQMDRLDSQISKRMENAEYLTKRLNEIDCIKTVKEDNRITRNSYHLFLLKYIEENLKGLPRAKFLKALSAEGVPISSGYVCLYKMPLFETEEMKRMTGSKIDYSKLYLDVSEKLTEKQGMWMTQNVLLAEKEDMDQIADAIIKVVENVDEII